MLAIKMATNAAVKPPKWATLLLEESRPPSSLGVVISVVKAVSMVVVVVVVDSPPETISSRAESFHATIVTIIHEIPNGIIARNVLA